MSNLDRSEYVQLAPTLVPVKHCTDNAFGFFTKHAVVNHESGITTLSIGVLLSTLLTEESQNTEFCARKSSLHEEFIWNRKDYDPLLEYIKPDSIDPHFWKEQFYSLTKELAGCLLKIYLRLEKDCSEVFVLWGIQTENLSPKRDEEAKPQNVPFPSQPGTGIFKSTHLNRFPKEPTIMIFGIIPQELHKQLLDLKNYQSRTNGVEELKNILAEFDLKPVPSDSIVDFISFLRTLLDDCNFKVLYGTLQVINLLIEKLDSNVEKYLKQIVSTTLKTLGDTHTISRNEYMNVFRQLMRIVGPQKVLDLVMGQLKNKNSRVREDIINIITAAMLTHPRKDFNIPSLCFEVAPCLADRKKRVRHAALELFAVFDYCLDTGKKQPLMRAVDKVELSGDVEGLMAAVQARRARHVLPRLSSEGMVEYALVIPKPGQRPSSQFGSGADLEWIQCGGRVDSARSSRTDPGSDSRLYGYGSLGSLTDNIPLHRRILSAGKNKLPWERSRLPATGKPLPARPTNSHSCEQISSEDSLSPPTELSREAYVADFGFSEPHQPRILGRKDPPSHGGSRKSGSVETDRPPRESASPSDSERAPPRAGRSLCRPSSAERTLTLTSSATAPGSLALPSSSTSPGKFLLPSYPLAKLPGSPRTPRLSHRHADSSLSLSSTWPNKRESSPRRRDTSPWREIQGDTTGDRRSPLPLRASLVRSSSTSSCRQALNGSRPVPPIPQGFQDHHIQQCEEGQAPHMPHPRTPPQDQPPEGKMRLDLSQLGALVQEEEPVDHEEMMNSLRSLRNSAAKKRAKVSLSGSDPDPDSPDSAVKLELALDSPSQTPPSVTSPLSESGLSSLYSPPNSTLNGTKASSGNLCSTVAKPRATRVSSGKKPAASIDFNSLQALSFGDKATADVSVVGQRVTYSNGPIEPEGERVREVSPPPARPTGREPVRAVRPTRGSQANGCRLSPAGGMSEGVIGKGVFGSSTPLPSSPVVATPQEQSDATSRTSGELPEGVYGHAVPSSHHDASDSVDTEEPGEKVKLSKSARDKMRQRRLEQEVGEQAELQRGEKAHQGLRHTVSESSIDELDTLRDWQLNGSEVAKPQAGTPQEDSTASSTSPQGTLSPIKSFSPHHQPSPPTLPPQSKTSLRRVRRAPSLNKTRPSFSNSSDELFPGQKKDDQEQPELRPFSNPELALTQGFALLSSNDWEKKIEGMTFLSCLTQYHTAVLGARLPDVCRALIPEVMNLRSGVSRVAVATLGNMYTHLQRGMDQELEGTATALLHKVCVSNAFLRQDVDAALHSMVQNCTPTRVMNALLTGGVRHLNSMVRKCTAQHMADLVEKIGAGRLLSGTTDLTDRILPAIARLAQDSSQEARYYGRQMLLFLASHQDFDKIVKKYIPAKDLPTLRDLVFTLKTKGLGEMPQDTPSARGRRSLPGSGTSRASSLPREPLSLVNRESREYNHRAQAHNIAERTEYIKQMKVQMGSKDFRERIKAIDQVAAECKNNPDMVIACIFPVFDAIKARLQESNSKVNLHALEALQRIIPALKENLAQVINILVPAIVDNHLNSKNNAIYSAAVTALETLMQDIDNALLLQIFVTKAQLLSGRAKVNLVDKVAELVMELYPHKPQAVEQKVLPLLWHLLSTSSNSGTTLGRGGSVRGATATLCQALYDQMGPRLMECAASQSHSVTKSLNQLLKTSSPLIACSEKQ
ncbi:TOG array regulator of axonemal microtubules protein 1 [Anguilla rostrata]|uniref:TOG array regulator of axonemal microtubules protein 1 n=1 Tax=Anguilla rostrata TaxID=7938 RepID=UPI0030CD9BCB